MAVMSEYTTVRSVLVGVSDEGDERVFREAFSISRNHTDNDAVRMARASVGEWRLSPSGDAYLLSDLLEVVRSERNAIGGDFNPRTIYQK